MAARTIDRLGRLLLVLLTSAIASRAHGAALDAAGDINLGVRAYTAARVATQDTDIQLIEQAPGRCPPHPNKTKAGRSSRRRSNTTSTGW